MHQICSLYVIDHECYLITRAHHGDEIPERDVTYHLMVTYLPLNYDTPALTPVLRPKYL